MNEEVRNKRAKEVTWAGFWLNIVLTVLKIFAGIQGKSAAMLADGIHSLSDFITDIVILIGFQFTAKPADESHNYGHGKFETFATVIIGLALIFAGYGIFKSGAQNIYAVFVQGVTLEKPGMISLVAAVISIVGKEWLFRYTRNVGIEINSPAVIANGWHHRSDVFSSFGTLIGIGGAIFLGSNWTILDPIASIVVSFFIFKVALEILAPAFSELMETSLGADDIDFIESTIAQHPEVVSSHKLRTRRIGSKAAIEVHIEVDPNLTVKIAHMIATEIEMTLHEHFGEAVFITTHIEPAPDRV